MMTSIMKRLIIYITLIFYAGRRHDIAFRVFDMPYYRAPISAKLRQIQCVSLLASHWRGNTRAASPHASARQLLVADAAQMLPANAFFIISAQHRRARYIRLGAAAMPPRRPRAERLFHAARQDTNCRRVAITAVREHVDITRAAVKEHFNGPSNDFAKFEYLPGLMI